MVAAFPRALLPLVAALLVAGCAKQGAFPSLAPRPVEQLGWDEPVRVAPAVAPEPALDARIAELLALARDGQAAFEAQLAVTRAAVSRAGAAQSESWIEAQQALSRLEAARAPTVLALADLDRLAIARANQPTNAAQYQALGAAVETAQGLSREQQAEVDRLRGALSPV